MNKITMTVQVLNLFGPAFKNAIRLLKPPHYANIIKEIKVPNNNATWITLELDEVETAFTLGKIYGDLRSKI